MLQQIKNLTRPIHRRNSVSFISVSDFNREFNSSKKFYSQIIKRFKSENSIEGINLADDQDRELNE